MEGWPLFRKLAMPSDMAAGFVEITRSPNQTIDCAVEDASAILESSLAAMNIAERKLWLVVADTPIKRTGRLVEYWADREKIWGLLERQGVQIPPGSRSDLKFPLSDDSFGLIGSVELQSNDIGAALTVTRRADAVLVATDTVAIPLPSLVPKLAEHAIASEPKLLNTLIELHGNWIFVARAFGKFDDRSVGVNVFAPDSFLDVLEPIMAVKAAVNPDHDA